METDNLQKFIEEAAGEMPALRRGILSLSQSDCGIPDLRPLLKLVSTVRAGGAARAVSEIELKAGELETSLSDLVWGEMPVPEAVKTGLLDHLANLEEALLQNYFVEGGPADDVSAFVEESFQSLQHSIDTPQPLEVALPGRSSQLSDDESTQLIGFDIDEELLEVFAMEAEGLLKNIESSLETLGRDPHDRDALWEVRRSAHTFKGAAGIVGLKKPSELAHRVEDLLDRMAEKDFATSVPVFDLLRRSTDCLHAMTGGDTSPQLAEHVAEVYSEFERVLQALSAPPPVAAPLVERRKRVPEPVTFETNAQYRQNGNSDEPDAEAKIPYRKRSIVRVSLERLDELVRITRDLLVDRSVFEQRLRDLELQIEELHNATHRLQGTSGKLEIDFEASMLGSPAAVIGNGDSAYRRRTQLDGGRFDDLELDRYTDFHQSTRQLSEAASDAVAIGNALDQVHGSFETLFDHQRLLVDEMQDRLMAIRMVEFSSLTTRLQRVVAVTCEEEDKKVRLTLHNAAQEMDTQILDALAEPLMHLLKNAVVHGIESPETRRLLGKPEIGEIVVTVSNEETHVVLTIADDGRGIALSAIREKAVSSGRISQERAAALTEEEICDLIFLPGLTTAEKLNLSAGRGVGMSIVKKSLESHRGQISIESHPQKGTVFSIRVPLTLAVTNALMVRAGCQTVAIPIRLIDEVSEHTNADVLKDEEFVYVVTDDGKIPLRPLAGLISSSVKSENTKPYFNALRIKCNGNTTMVAVDDILRTEEVVIKSLGRPLDNINGILGAAILGNGELVPILDMPVLLNTQTSHIAQREIPPEPAVELNVMIVDDSPSVRHMSSKIIANAGWVASTAIDGIDAIEKLRSLNKLPDIILSDIEMPRMDGYELVATLRRSDKFAKIPVIMVTSRSGDKHREKAIETGVSEYLTKPYDEKELISMIERLVHVPA